jgi:hypothetical protein
MLILLKKKKYNHQIKPFLLTYLLTYVTSVSSYFVIYIYIYIFYKTHDLCNRNQWRWVHGSNDSRFSYGVFDSYVSVYGGVIGSFHNSIAEGSREKNSERAMVMQMFDFSFYSSVLMENV